jgi:hypothetical protein
VVVVPDGNAELRVESWTSVPFCGAWHSRGGCGVSLGTHQSFSSRMKLGVSS